RVGVHRRALGGSLESGAGRAAFPVLPPDYRPPTTDSTARPAHVLLEDGPGRVRGVLLGLLDLLHLAVLALADGLAVGRRAGDRGHIEDRAALRDAVVGGAGRAAVVLEQQDGGEVVLGIRGGRPGRRR